MALLTERSERGVVVLRLDRPDVRNALDTAHTRDLTAALGAAGDDDTARVVVLSTTSVRALCAGADVSEPLSAAGGVERMEAFAELYAALEACPIVTIA